MDKFEENKKWWKEFVTEAFREWIKNHKKTPVNFIFNTIDDGKLTANQILEKMEKNEGFGKELIREIKLKLMLDPKIGFRDSQTEEEGKLFALLVVVEMMKKLECLSTFNS